MALNFINNKGCEKLPEVNGNGGQDLWPIRVCQRKGMRRNNSFAICCNLMMGPNCGPK